MSEQRQRSRHVPLRVRFRPAAEQIQLESALAPNQDIPIMRTQAPAEDSAGVPDVVVDISEVLQYTQQIKELLRLSNLLRGNQYVEKVLQQLVTSTSVCTGFRTLVINLIEEENGVVAPVAFEGLLEERRSFIKEHPVTTEQMHTLMRPEFRISQSYFFPQERVDSLPAITSFVDNTLIALENKDWLPEDFLIVPLTSSDTQKLLGFLAFGAPYDGKRPVKESVEVVELFADQAAAAIENARIFQQREVERIELEMSIAQLKEDLEHLHSGDLRTRVRPLHTKLQPVGQAINTMIGELSDLLSSVKMVTEAVDEHTRSVQRNSDFLVHDTGQQKRQVQQIFSVITEIASMMQQVSRRADELLKIAMEAMEVTLEGQGKVDRAVDGMSKVREATMHSARTMKNLGESGQEINETVTDITDLTARMHLLALNAAIEATRAGERGHGFAVVAQEIRTLATQCTDASRKVASYIRTIQRETNAVSQSVEQSTQQVVVQTELVTQTGIALDAISAVTEQMMTLVQGICTTADGQVQSSQLVVNAVNEIHRMTGEITQHMLEMQHSLAHLVELTDSLRSQLAGLLMAE